MLRRAVVVTGILAVLSFAGTARAQPGNTPPGGAVPPPATYLPPPTYAPPAATHTERYGTSVAAMDALAAGLVLVGALVLIGAAFGDGDEDTAGVGVVMMVGGVGVYTFGPAYIHTRHDNTSSAWKSIALRVGLPALGGLLGSALDQETCDEYGYCYSDDETAGQLSSLGILAAMVIDWGVLAKVQVPATTAPYYPYAAPTAGGGGTFGLADAF